MNQYQRIVLIIATIIILMMGIRFCMPEKSPETYLIVGEIVAKNNLTQSLRKTIQVFVFSITDSSQVVYFDTLSAGRFNLRIKPGNYSFLISSKGFQTQVDTLQIISDTTMSWTLHPAHLSEITLNFFRNDLRTRAPIDNLDFTFESEQLRTSLNGDYTLSNIIRGDYRITVKNRYYISLDTTIMVTPNDRYFRIGLQPRLLNLFPVPDIGDVWNFKFTAKEKNLRANDTLLTTGQITITIDDIRTSSGDTILVVTEKRIGESYHINNQTQFIQDSLLNKESYTYSTSYDIYLHENGEITTRTNERPIFNLGHGWIKENRKPDNKDFYRFVEADYIKNEVNKKGNVRVTVYPNGTYYDLKPGFGLITLVYEKSGLNYIYYRLNRTDNH